MWPHQKMFVAVLTLVVCSVVLSNSQVAKRYCGANLTSALSLICDGNFYEGSKRSGFIEADSYYPEEEYQEAVDVFRSRRSAVAIDTRRFRVRRGVADECCAKACTVNELQTYCAQ